jgi:hypothetical protein
VLASEGYRLWRGALESGAAIDAQLVPARLPESVAGHAGLKVVCKSAGEFRVLVDGADSGRSCPVEQRIPLRPGLHRLSLFSPRGNRTVVVEHEITVKNRGASTRIVLEEP